MRTEDQHEGTSTQIGTVFSLCFQIRKKLCTDGTLVLPCVSVCTRSSYEYSLVESAAAAAAAVLTAERHTKHQGRVSVCVRLVDQRPENCYSYAAI